MNSMRWAVLTVSLGFFCALARAHEGHEAHGDAASQGQSVTLKGEVLDMACYMAHEAKGAKHKKCAGACILNGAPMGLLQADGDVVLLLEDHDNAKPYKALQELAAAQVEVTGKLFKRGGLPALVVVRVKKAG